MTKSFLLVEPALCNRLSYFVRFFYSGSKIGACPFHTNRSYELRPRCTLIVDVVIDLFRILFGEAHACALFCWRRMVRILQASASSRSSQGYLSLPGLVTYSWVLKSLRKRGR
jgi:hypothetical protein